MNPIRRQRILQPSFHNLIFNQGIKNICVFEVVVVVVVVGGGVGGCGRRKQKNVRTSGKILATPLIRTQMID